MKKAFGGGQQFPGSLDELRKARSNETRQATSRE
jgi:hypothetical protein